MDFDVIPHDDIKWGYRLGAGSFGSVFKGTYLGVDIAIKEVLPSTEYDVHKYFEREWRIMRECRHPNIVLFLGLSKAPGNDGRVYIISEFVPRGNLRQYILSSRPFPWRLRLSFATDVARALAYLHARQCIHRDLKGENLLITSNERIKVTDFGFARIASRNAEEMKRMTYCGTDGYMSPEIINGFEFDLPTDVFSLGMIFIEIMCRRLVDSKHFIREAPSFTPNPEEVRRRASPGCPPALIELALHCCQEDPLDRPKMSEVLTRLREIELDVLSNMKDETEHVGSIKLQVGMGKRGMPSFEPLNKDPKIIEKELREAEKDDEGDDDIKKMEEDALEALGNLKVDGKGADGSNSTGDTGEDDDKDTWRTARWEERPSILTHLTDPSEIRASSDTSSASETGSSSMDPPSLKGNPLAHDSRFKDATPAADVSSTMTVKATPSKGGKGAEADNPALEPVVRTPVKLQTKLEKAQKAEEEAAKNAPPLAKGTHRFTLIEKDKLALMSGKKQSALYHPLAAFLPKALAPSSKCPVCQRRLGARPALQCDDCQIIVHVKCSHGAARNCDEGIGKAA